MTGSGSATQCEVSCCVAGRRAAVGPTSRPTIIAVDADELAIERISAELRSRYSRDYDVACFTDAGEAATALEALHDGGRRAAIVLAAVAIDGAAGSDVL